VDNLKNSKIYDVVIIGAGPAGTAVAKTLLESKLSLIIIDKAKFPRNKPCAGVLPPRIYSELDIPETIQERPLEGYRLYAPSGAIVESNFPKPGLIVNRAPFDEFLVNKLGVKITQDHISDLRKNDDYIEFL
jgi:flavin-dependent dehydrogenase